MTNKSMALYTITNLTVINNLLLNVVHSMTEHWCISQIKYDIRILGDLDLISLNEVDKFYRYIASGEYLPSVILEVLFTVYRLSNDETIKTYTLELINGSYGEKTILEKEAENDKTD